MEIHLLNSLHKSFSYGYPNLGTHGQVKCPVCLETLVVKVLLTEAEVQMSLQPHEIKGHLWGALLCLTIPSHFFH